MKTLQLCDITDLYALLPANVSNPADTTYVNHFYLPEKTNLMPGDFVLSRRPKLYADTRRLGLIVAAPNEHEPAGKSNRRMLVLWSAQNEDGA